METVEIQRECVPGEEHLGAARELWVRWKRTRSLYARNALIEYFGPWCKKIAGKMYVQYQHDYLDWEDFFNTAHVALLKCICRFNPNQGIPFEAYCYSCIRGATLDFIAPYIRDNGSVKDVTLSSIQKHTPSIERMISSQITSSCSTEAAVDSAFGRFLELGLLPTLSEEYSPHLMYETDRMLKRVLGLVEQLALDEAYVLKAHYVQGLRFVEIAQLKAVSRARISQIHKSAICSLRKLINIEK